MLPYGTLRLGPAMLFCSVEHGILCFADVGGVTSRTSVSIDHTGITQQRNLVFVGCVERHFGRLKMDIELDFSMIFEESHKSFLAPGDDGFCFFSVVWKKHIEIVKFFFSFLLFGVFSSGLKTFFDDISCDPLWEPVVGGELSDVGKFFG